MYFSIVFKKRVFRLYRLIQIVFFVLISVGLYAQSYSNQRLKRFYAITDTLKLDTLSIIPGSELIIDAEGRIIDSSYYRINYPNALLLPDQKLKAQGYSITATYRVFPLSFSKIYLNKDKGKLISPDSLLGRQSARYIAYKSSSKPFGDNIEASGSISRGISFGNNQDAVISSGLNLQLSGEIDNHIMIEGAISDKTIPFQPQGNTQRLEEFDRIYLRAYTSKFEVQAGDVEIESRGNGFLRYNRNVQGLALSIQDDFLAKEDSTRIQASAAVAKGKFSRNSFVGVEGNQGPYRLTGSEGETYLVVIAGSERVYVDGTLMVRGETNQYTIDYNTAELTFTPMMRITGSIRISVEFEYTERSYARFVLTSGVEQRIKSTTVRVNAFSEQDSKNQPIDQDMSREQIDLLAQIGDRIDQAIIPQADSADFNPDKIMYEKRDTLVNSTNYRIYRYSTNPTTSHFVVNFSYLGDGKGSYIPQYSSANGRVYVWVAPINGKLSGSYEPVRVLVTPKRKQMATVSVERNFSNSDAISAEAAFSRNDLNTFSSMDKSNDVGEALTLGFRKSIWNDSIRSVWIFGGGTVTSPNFTYVDRYRPVEFERDWNINQRLTGSDEKELLAGFGFRSARWIITGTSQGLKIGGDYSGFRNSIRGGYKTSKISNEVEFSNLLSSDSLRTSGFNRIRVKTDIKIYSIVAGLSVEGEDNRQRNVSSERLLPTSFRWVQSGFRIGLPDSLPRMVGLTYTYRKDWKSSDSVLRLYSFSQDFGMNARLAKRQNSRLNLYAGYRMFSPVDTSLSKTVKRENTLLGRLDYYFVVAKGFITSNLGYELGSGLEPQYQFYYVEVPAGQGVYTWNDYNANGVKELDEFEIATFKDEAKYIRINLQSNQYISVNNNALSAQFDIRPDNLIRDTSIIGVFVKKLSNQFSYSTRQKNGYADFSKSINPLRHDAYDTNLVSITENYRNAIAFNRFSRAFGVEWVNSSSIAKQILANGYEIAKISSNQINAWLGISSGFSLRLNYLAERKIQESEFFQQRSYNIKRSAPAVKLRYTGMLGFNAEMGYEYEYSENRSGLEVNRKHTVSAEMGYSLRGKSWITLTSSLSKINFKGDLGTPLEYEFLKGYKPGSNAIWEVSFRRKISTYFEMNIRYNGRYISTGSVVHTGSMEVRAVF